MWLPINRNPREYDLLNLTSTTTIKGYWAGQTTAQEKFPTMITVVLTGKIGNINDGGKVSEKIVVSYDVRLGCLLAPRNFPSSYRQISKIITEARGWRLHSRQTRDIFNVAINNIKKTRTLPSQLYKTREMDIMVHGNKLNSVLELTFLGITISIDGCLAVEIRGRIAHPLANYARDSVITTMCQKHHLPHNRVTHYTILHWGLDSVHTTERKAICFHDPEDSLE